MTLEDDQTTLTAEEAGAFVTQWADKRTVAVDDLARRFDLDEGKAVSLARQARGQLHMAAWLEEKRSWRASGRVTWLPIVIALIVGALIGCLIMRYVVSPAPGAGPNGTLPPPPITAS